MSQPINLNRYRKDKARAEKRAKGDENAARFGRSKDQKRLEDDQAAKAARHLDGHKQEE